VVESVGPELPWTQADFAEAGERLEKPRPGSGGSSPCAGGARLLGAAGSVVSLVSRIGPEYGESLDDIRRQVEGLFRGRWLLEGSSAWLAVDWQGLEARITRMLGAHQAKDLAKLERWEGGEGGLPTLRHVLVGRDI